MRTPSIVTKRSCPRNQALHVLQCSGAKLIHIGSMVNDVSARLTTPMVSPGSLRIVTKVILRAPTNKG